MDDSCVTYVESYKLFAGSMGFVIGSLVTWLMISLCTDEPKRIETETEDDDVNDADDDDVNDEEADEDEDEDDEDDEDDDAEEEDAEEEDAEADAKVDTEVLIVEEKSGKRNKFSMKVSDTVLLKILEAHERMYGDYIKAKPTRTEVADDETPTTVEDELNDILDKELQSRGSSLPTAIGGGYATLSDLADRTKKNKETASKMLSRQEELNILGSFRNVVNMSLDDAADVVKKEGYSLHVLYVGCGTKMPLATYSPTVIGVRVADEDYDFYRRVPSQRAVVAELIDVGGIDYHHRGEITL